MIGHELTAFYGLDHGQTLAIVLPGLLEVLFEDKKAKLAQMGQRVFQINTGDEEAIARATIKAIDTFFQKMGVKTRLSDYGLSKAAIDRVVTRGRERNWKLGEHQRITPEVVEAILLKRL
jgi:NADP-dependent alcohol dehydrogenase